MWIAALVFFFHAGELRACLEQARGDESALDQIFGLDIYRQQYGKYLYLVEKFLASVSDPDTLHVFSDFHEELSDDAMLRVMACLRAMGKPQVGINSFTNLDHGSAGVCSRSI